MTARGSRLARWLLVVGVWAAATALAGLVAWIAVSRLGWGGTAVASRPLSLAQVRIQLDKTPADQPVAPRVRLTPRTARDHHRPAPRPHTRSWQLSGGSVGVTCRGPVVELAYATPLDGWAYRLDRHDTASLSVEFSREQLTSGLVAHCVHGRPILAATEDSHGQDSGGDD